jgi:hypothetical protein
LHPARLGQTFHGDYVPQDAVHVALTTKDMKPDKKCIDRCVRKGSKYGLWVEHHVYELEPLSEAAQYAVKDVSVTGTVDGETIHIDSIKPINPPTAKKSESN